MKAGKWVVAGLAVALAAGVGVAQEEDAPEKKARAVRTVLGLRVAQFHRDFKTAVMADQALSDKQKAELLAEYLDKVAAAMFDGRGVSVAQVDLEACSAELRAQLCGVAASRAAAEKAAAVAERDRVAAELDRLGSEAAQ